MPPLMLGVPTTGIGPRSVRLGPPGTSAGAPPPVPDARPPWPRAIPGAILGSLAVTSCSPAEPFTAADSRPPRSVGPCASPGMNDDRVGSSLIGDSGSGARGSTSATSLLGAARSAPVMVVAGLVTIARARRGDSARLGRSPGGTPASGTFPGSSLCWSAAVLFDAGGGVGASSIRTAVTTGDAARDTSGVAEGAAGAPVGLDDGTATDLRNATGGIVDGAERADIGGTARVTGTLASGRRAGACSGGCAGDIGLRRDTGIERATRAGDSSWRSRSAEACWRLADASVRSGAGTAGCAASRPAATDWAAAAGSDAVTRPATATSRGSPDRAIDRAAASARGVTTWRTESGSGSGTGGGVSRSDVVVCACRATRPPMRNGDSSSAGSTTGRGEGSEAPCARTSDSAPGCDERATGVGSPVEGWAPPTSTAFGDCARITAADGDRSAADRAAPAPGREGCSATETTRMGRRFIATSAV